MSPVKKVAEGAYFVIDTLAFENAIALYDPLVATQTIAVDYATDVIDEPDIVEADLLEEGATTPR